MSPQHRFCQLAELIRRQIGWRAPAEVQRIDFMLGLCSGNFNRNRSQIVVHQIVAACHEREVAIAAAVVTERHVNISRAWRSRRRIV